LQQSCFFAAVFTVSLQLDPARRTWRIAVIAVVHFGFQVQLTSSRRQKQQKRAAKKVLVFEF
jgi:hypothetical protein